jgi:hypothetical protein
MKVNPTRLHAFENANGLDVAARENGSVERVEAASGLLGASDMVCEREGEESDPFDAILSTETRDAFRELVGRLPVVRG